MFLSFPMTTMHVQYDLCSSDLLLYPVSLLIQHQRQLYCRASNFETNSFSSDFPFPSTSPPPPIDFISSPASSYISASNMILCLETFSCCKIWRRILYSECHFEFSSHRGYHRIAWNSARFSVSTLHKKTI